MPKATDYKPKFYVILRGADGQSYVCDVNGLSMVKGSPSYWADAASVRADLDAFERALPGLAIPPAKAPSSEAEA